MTALIYFILYFVEMLQGNQRFQILIEISYVSIVVILGIYGFYLYRSSRFVKLWENILVNFLGVIIVTIIIIRTNGIDSLYFPFLYLIPFVYSAFSKGRKFFIISNLMYIITPLIWVFFTNSPFTSLLNSDFFVAIALYLVIINIIRIYRLECFSCKLEKNSCSIQDSCLFYQKRWNNQLGDEKNDK